MEEMARVKLRLFLYILLRNHMPFGKVEDIMENIRRMEDPPIFGEKYIEAYANALTSEIMDD